MLSGVSYEEFSASPLADCFVEISPNSIQSGEIMNRTYFVKLSAEFPSYSEYMIGSEGNPDGMPEKFRLLLSPYAIAVGNRGTLISLAEKHLCRTDPKFIKQCRDPDGYNRIDSYHLAPSRRVARIVATAWHPGPNQNLEVDHTDGNRANDAANNLEWVTRSENLQRIKARPRPYIWPADITVLIINPQNCCAKIVTPNDARHIINSPNSAKLLRGQRHYSHGWLVLVNPTFEAAVNLCERYLVMNPEIMSLLRSLFDHDASVLE